MASNWRVGMKTLGKIMAFIILAALCGFFIFVMVAFSPYFG